MIRVSGVLHQLGESFSHSCPNASSISRAKEDSCESGILWWDVAHMTSYGQRVAADWLASALADIIRAP